MTQHAPAERLLVLTFCGVLIYEMSFWDKTGRISPPTWRFWHWGTKNELFGLITGLGLDPPRY